jgi:hypothetical protein
VAVSAIIILVVQSIADRLEMHSLIGISVVAAASGKISPSTYRGKSLPLRNITQRMIF